MFHFVSRSEFCEAPFKITLQKCKNLDTCIRHYNIWNKKLLLNSIYNDTMYVIIYL